jgi:phosphoglycolate phosphatase
VSNGGNVVVDPSASACSGFAVALFDIDGTLTASPDLNHQLAAAAALQDVYGQAATEGELELQAFHGLTTPGLAHSFLGRRGLTEQMVDLRLTEWRDAMLTHFQRIARERSHPVLFSDVRAAIAELRSAGLAIGLLTGNYQSVAEAKLAAVGIWREFDAELSGFGDDAVKRVDVARAAKKRIEARFGPQTRIYVVGDTPRDVDCGKAIGAVIVAVTTGQSSAADLREANAITSSLTEAARFILQHLTTGEVTPPPRERS